MLFLYSRTCAVVLSFSSCHINYWPTWSCCSLCTSVSSGLFSNHLFLFGWWWKKKGKDLIPVCTGFACKHQGLQETFCDCYCTNRAVRNHTDGFTMQTFPPPPVFFRRFCARIRCQRIDALLRQRRRERERERETKRQRDRERDE